jgi:chromosome segregation protein
MYFKKLELIGFKSFMEKTTLHFEPGITAVVGPNGCGKSNIFDSIRWVLGEQSAKSLRGSEMQDVIFNGTDFKDPLGMAEVSLVFDNTNRIFAIDHHEVAITRRIFRSGESEYLLNKTQVRLKDILDLLSGTGIGSEGYSLMEQGKIDLILSSRPEDRRLVFDEASGITRYKMQKKEAARRLEETEQNLLRVNDIIIEVKRQIGSLERQASKARRYKEVFDELKAKEINLAILQKRELLREKDELIQGLTQLQIEEIKLINTVKEQESRTCSRQMELKSIEDKMMAIKNEILNLDNLALRNNEHISFNQERIIELESRKKILEAQVEQAKGKLVADEEKLNNVRVEHGSIKKNIEEKILLLKDAEAKLNSLNTCVKISHENIARAKKEILDLVTASANLRNEITGLTSKQQIHLARKKRLDLEKAKITEEEVGLADNLNQLKGELEGLESNYQDLNSKLTGSKRELEAERLAVLDLNKELESLEKEKFILESQKKFLEELKTKYEDISESMNAVIYLDKLPRENMTGLVMKVKGRLDLNQADKDTIGSMSVKLSGEAKPIDLDTQGIIGQILSIAGKINALKDNLTGKARQIEGLHVVIQDMERDFRAQEIAIANKKAAGEALSGQLNKIKDEEAIIVIELSEVDQELLIWQEKSSHLQSQLSELENKHQRAEELVSSEVNNIAVNADLKEQALVKITQTRTELEALTRRIGSDEATLRILEGTYAQDKESLLNLETQIEDACLKKESLHLESKGLDEKIKEAENHLGNQKALLQETEIKHREASDGGSEIIKKIELDRLELDSIKNRLHGLEMQNKDVDFKISTIKDRISQGYKVDLDALIDTATEQLAAQNATFEILKDLDENTLLGEVEKLKVKLDSYGTVNLVAIEEYDELKKRYDFLNQQQNDLISAKESLHEAILKINRTTRKMFLETFEKICLEFRNYFKLLFNGGDAQVFLIDDQDPLESGIEIICRPPGKKLQNVLLLSGGEKALSATALLFAIFKIKPAPFCVLDEIDAALDESNVERFSRMLQEFATTSQFIVITHNKRTIAGADVMYGITMEESGVSKIVSVKFGQRVKPKEDVEPVAAPA